MQPIEIVRLLQSFFEKFDPKVVSSQSSKLYCMVSVYADQLIAIERPIFGIKTLSEVIHKTQKGNVECVVGNIHKEFARLCIKAKCYQHALPIISHPVTVFTKDTQPMDLLSYMYYRGIIFISQKQYLRAIECFKTVISFPANILHKIHTESYKKLTLLSMLINGRDFSLPKSTNLMVLHRLENFLQPYKNLAKQFEQKDDNQFNGSLEKMQEEFLKDGNLGLLKKVVKAYQRKRIQEMSNTYLTLRYT